MSSGPTPTDDQPQPNPPANSGLAPPSPIDALKPGLDGKVESLKKAVISILEVSRLDIDRLGSERSARTFR